MTKRKIVDAHHHLWDLDLGYNYPWLQDRPLGVGVCGEIDAIAGNYLPEDFLGDSANYELVKSVHIEAVADNQIKESAWLQRLAENGGFPHGIVAGAKLNAPDIETTLEAHSQFANVKGIRHIVNWHHEPRLTFTDRSDLMTDPNWLKGFALLDKYGLSFDLQLYPNQMADALTLARANPNTLIILNHTGMPADRDADGISEWHQGMSQLASAENVVVKISGLGMVDWDWTPETIAPFVRHTIECFGADRCMFGSNFPVDKLYSSFTDIFQAFEQIVSDMDETDLDAMFHTNALKYYRL